MSWITETSDGVVIQLRIVTRASKSGLAEVIQDELKVRLQAPPVDGKANRALIGLLSKKLRVPAGSVTIVSGLTSRHKRVAIEGRTPEEIRGLLDR